MKPKIILTASFEHNEENIDFIKGLNEASARETNGNRSKLIYQILKKYVEDHDAGNNQQRLDNIMKTGKTYVAKGECFWKGCTKPAIDTAKYIPNKKEYKVCPVHLRELRGNRNWKPMGRKLGQ